jgi:U4/U6.U5 tri-snRNP-associated protein 1
LIIDDRGIYNVGAIEREKEMSRNALEQKAISLELPQLNIPSEYYSSEEMVKFKKRKKMKKKKEKFKIADLVPLDNEDKGKDHGSRNRIKEGYTTTTTTTDEPMEISIDNVKDDPSLLDDKDTKVETALERTRRLLKRAKNPSTAGTSMIPMAAIKREKTSDEPSTGGDVIILDTTAEFCRQIGEEELPQDMINRVKDENERMDYEDEDDDDRLIDKKESIPEKPDVLELEAKTHLTGVMAAIQMASKKGFIEHEKEQLVKKKNTKTIIEGLGVRDWEYEKDRGRERERDRDGHGREVAFCEKKGYVPEVNIEYVDDKGRLLTAKEAFQIMSHKFHGKGPGKKKTEKKLKREQEEIVLNKADAGDTPLQSLELLRKKQESSHSAYIPLTGHQPSLTMTELVKRK